MGYDSPIRGIQLSQLILNQIMLWLGFIYCTFRYESEFDAFTGASTEVSIVTSDYSELSSPVDRTVNPSYEQIEEMVGKAIERSGGIGIG